MADGKTAIVTGAGTGIGKAVATALLQAGWNTVFFGTRARTGSMKSIAAAGPTEAKAIAIACDIYEAG